MSNPQSMYLFGEAVQNGFVVKDDYKIAESTEGSEDKFFIRVNNKKYLVKDFEDANRIKNDDVYARSVLPNLNEVLENTWHEITENRYDEY